jgi:hypothetical protein
MLFVDSDIYFRADSILKMLKKDKELMSIPYPLKTMMWDKLYKKWNDGEVKGPEDIHRYLNTYPMKVENPEDIISDIEYGLSQVEVSGLSIDRVAS